MASDYDKMIVEHLKKKDYTLTMKTKTGGFETVTFRAKDDDEAYECVQEYAAQRGFAIHTWKPVGGK